MRQWPMRIIIIDTVFQSYFDFWALKQIKYAFIACIIFIQTKSWAFNNFQNQLGFQLDKLTWDQIADISQKLCQEINDTLPPEKRIPIYNKNSWSHFYVNSTEICLIEWEHCTPKEVFEMLLKYPTPFYLGNGSANDGSKSWVLPLGRVYHIVNNDNLLITNITIPWQHILSPGKAMRFVSVRDNGDGAVAIHIDTIGEGEGFFSYLNVYLAQWLWSLTDRAATDDWFPKNDDD
jgi:hypothetical protein